MVDVSTDGRLEAYGSLDGSVTVVDTQAASTVAHLLDLQELNAGNEFPATSFIAPQRFDVESFVFSISETQSSSLSLYPMMGRNCG